MLEIIFLFFHLSFAIFIFCLCIAFITGAPYVPSQMARARSMIELAHLKKGKVIYDLGSGDGRLLMLAAAEGADAYGVEINPFLVYFTWIRAVLSPFRKLVHVRCKNLWTSDISKADVVFIYLLPWRMEELAKKLKKELKPGAIVVSNSFIFPNWKIKEQDTKNHVYAFEIR